MLKQGRQIASKDEQIQGLQSQLDARCQALQETIEMLQRKEAVLSDIAANQQEEYGPANNRQGHEGSIPGYTHSEGRANQGQLTPVVQKLLAGDGETTSDRCVDKLWCSYQL
jgi:hypothetical protein